MSGKRAANRLICFIIIFSMTSGLIPFVNVSAADSPFSDVSDSQYFSTEVNSMYEQGVINGYGDGKFYPDNPVKHSEAIKLVCSMAGISLSGYSSVTTPWYASVMNWAKDNGIMPADTDPDTYATREEICGYIFLVYKMNPSSSDKSVFSDTNSAIANTLYDCGVVRGITGSDGTITFGGAQNVKRCDTSIMLYRLSEKVQKPDWGEIYSLDRSQYQVSRPSSFTTYDDYVNAWSYMLTNTVCTDSYTVTASCSKAELKSMMDKIQSACYFARFGCIEYASFLSQWQVGTKYSVDRNGNCINPTFTLTLLNGCGLSNEEVSKEIQEFNSTCGQIVTKLYAEGALKNSMTVKEKALVLYKYMACNTKYDLSYKYYNGYDAAVLGTAVCQGYTAMYNYLCNLAGVKMEGMTGKTEGASHAWSRINVDGTYYNVDATWSDPCPDTPNYCDEDWFWLTDDAIKASSPTRTFDSDTLVYG
jgi:hypothetical protein